MAEDFVGGMKEGMSIFMMSSLAANYQAQQENMAENRQLRIENQARLREEDRRQSMQADMSMVKLVVDPANGVPDDIALTHLNQMSAKYGLGQPLGLDDMKKFDAELGAFTKQTQLATGEERRAAFQPLAEKASEHVGYTRAYIRHKDQIEEFLGKPAASAAFQASGFTSANTDKLLKNLKPGESLALLKDNDWRKAAIYTQASETVKRVTNGEEVPEGELAQVLTAAHGAGFKLGDSAADIVKGTTGEAQYNLSQKDLASFNQTVINPFTKAINMIPGDKLIQTVARAGGNKGLTSIGNGPDETVGALLPPEQNKQFMQSLAKMQAVNEQANKQFQDIQARYKIAKANPLTTPSDLILLDQQVKVEREKANALAAPYNAYKTFVDEPTGPNYQAILNASKKADTTLRQWEGDKQKLLTITEQKTQQEIVEGKTKLATGQATNDAQEQLLTQMQAGGVTRDQEQKIRQLASPIIQSTNQKYGVKLDVDELMKGFKPEGTLNIKFPDAGERKDIAEAANLLKGYNQIEALYDPSFVGMIEGKAGSFKEATGLIGQQQADFYQSVDTLARSQRKFFGGVAVTPTELKLLLSTVVNRGMSDQQFTSSVRVNKIVLGGDAQAKIAVLKELGFKTPEKTAKAIDEALEKAQGEVEAGANKKKAAAVTGFTMEGFMALKKAHPDWSPTEIGAAAARGEK